MKIGILGSGMVGQSIASGFSKEEVIIGTRDKQKLADFAAKTGVKVGSFEDAAKFGDILFLCTKWTGTKEAIKMAGHNFSGKIVVDVTNPLAFEGQTPKLDIGYPDSAGAQIQKLLPDSKVVKAFNTVTASYMTKAAEGSPDLFICGNDEHSKKKVSEMASKWGWNVIDMGGIEQAYLLEALAMLWIRYGFMNNHWTHAWKLLNK